MATTYQLSIDIADFGGTDSEGTLVEIRLTTEGGDILDAATASASEIVEGGLVGSEHTDSNGQATFDLIATDEIEPASKYEARIDIEDGVPYTFIFTMPDSNSNLAGLIRNPPSPTPPVVAGSLSNNDPQDLGTTAPGSGTQASRDDHVHGGGQGGVGGDTDQQARNAAATAQAAAATAQATAVAAQTTADAAQTSGQVSTAIGTHTGVADAHHAKYTDAEADARVQAAKGTVAPGNTPGTPAPGTDDVWSPTDHDHGITVPTTSGLDQAAVDARVQAAKGTATPGNTSGSPSTGDSDKWAHDNHDHGIASTVSGTALTTELDVIPAWDLIWENAATTNARGLTTSGNTNLDLITGKEFDDYDIIVAWIDNGPNTEGKFMYIEREQFANIFISSANGSGWVDWSDNGWIGMKYFNNTTFRKTGGGMGLRKLYGINGNVTVTGLKGDAGDAGDGLNTGEVQTLINATNLSALQGMVTNDQIPAAIMRDAELTAAAVRTLLGLTATEVNDLVTGGTLTGTTLTFTQNDGSTISITLPATGESTADGVVASGVFNTDQTELILTLDTGGTVTIDVPAALRVEGLTARAINILSERADSDVHSNAIFAAVYNGVIHKYEFVDIITLARSSAGLGNMLNPLPTTNNVGEYPRQTASGYELVDPGRSA